MNDIMGIKFTDGANIKAEPKRKQNRAGIGWLVIILLGLTSIFGMIITLFFSLYFAAPDYQFFLILAVLGILFYSWIVYSILRPKGYDPVIRIKGQEKSLWGVIIVVSFVVLIAYYLICGATMIFELHAHSELFWKVFNAVCSGKLFWWITSISINILIVAWVEREVEIKKALEGNHQSNVSRTSFSQNKASMIMDTRKNLAAEKKRCNSHNCTQAVTSTYCDLVGLPEQTALDIAGAYGTGMGNMEGTCGALVGAGMIVGLATKDRIKSRARMKEMMEKFQARNGATQCRLLKGIGTGKPLRDCPDCVADASEFLEEYL